MQISRLLLALTIAAGIEAENHYAALTIKQAEALALNAPPTLNAAQGACCPDAHGYAVKAGSIAAPYTLIWVQVRCGCSASAGQLIDNYTVNPKTGQIWEGFEDAGKPLTSKRLDAVRRASFQEVQRRQTKVK